MAKVAVVTGASRGIGAAIAVRLASDGYHVVLVARTAAACAAVARQIAGAGGSATTEGANLEDRSATARLADQIREQFPSIRVLVNNAGYGRVAPIERVTDADWDEVMEVNLHAPFALTRALMPALRRAAAEGDAAVVNVGSVMGAGVAPAMVSYTTAKGALHQLTRALAVELGPEGIRVNAVAPGFIRTDLFERSHPPQRQAALAESHPLRRVGDPIEVASVVAFLCSADAGFVSGVVLPVDGGLAAVLAVPPLD